MGGASLPGFLTRTVVWEAGCARWLRHAVASACQPSVPSLGRRRSIHWVPDAPHTGGRSRPGQGCQRATQYLSLVNRTCPDLADARGTTVCARGRPDTATILRRLNGPATRTPSFRANRSASGTPPVARSYRDGDVRNARCALRLPPTMAPRGLRRTGIPIVCPPITTVASPGSVTSGPAPRAARRISAPRSVRIRCYRESVAGPSVRHCVAHGLPPANPPPVTHYLVCSLGPASSLVGGSNDHPYASC